MQKVFKYLLSIISAILVFLILNTISNINILVLPEFVVSYSIYIEFIVAIIFGLIFNFIFSPHITGFIFKKLSNTEDKLTNMSFKDLMVSIIGLIVGLAVANLIGLAFWGYGLLTTAIIAALNILFGYLGYKVATRTKDDAKSALFKTNETTVSVGRPKILDTSVIIDGRILDLLHTGFIEGTIIIPEFVLDELRHIADSSDNLKRNRGRRGLDILNEIQKQLSVPVKIMDYKTNDKLEVDSKLLKMAEKIDAFVVTNDYNLNKVAEFQGVKVLNINELANAVKPIAMPGEILRVTIIKEGKENQQGIGYLDDGTMIVVEGANKYIGLNLEVVVTSVIQTAAGRMIFTKLRER